MPRKRKPRARGRPKKKENFTSAQVRVGLRAALEQKQREFDTIGTKQVDLTSR